MAKLPEFYGEDAVVMECIRTGNYSEAIRLTSGAVSKDISNHQAVLFMGVACLHSGKYSVALKCFRMLIKYHPTNSSVWNNYAECFTRMGYIDRAATVFYNLVDGFPYTIAEIEKNNYRYGKLFFPPSKRTASKEDIAVRDKIENYFGDSISIDDVIADIDKVISGNVPFEPVALPAKYQWEEYAECELRD